MVPASFGFRCVILWIGYRSGYYLIVALRERQVTKEHVTRCKIEFIVTDRKHVVKLRFQIGITHNRVRCVREIGNGLQLCIGWLLAGTIIVYTERLVTRKVINKLAVGATLKAVTRLTPVNTELPSSTDGCATTPNV
jgi:hypothetical protein